VKAFNDLFGTREGRHSWLDVQTGHINDNVLNLKSARLTAYLWNNYGDDLFTPVYRKSLEGERKHNRVKIKTSSQSPYSVYYSGYKKSCECPLTGVCYDMDLLKPILKAMHEPVKETFEDLLTECFENLRIAIENEIEYRNSDESKTEDIKSNGYEFTENGKIF